MLATRWHFVWRAQLYTVLHEGQREHQMYVRRTIWQLRHVQHFCMTVVKSLSYRNGDLSTVVDFPTLGLCHPHLTD